MVLTPDNPANVNASATTSEVTSLLSSARSTDPDLELDLSEDLALELASLLATAEAGLRPDWSLPSLHLLPSLLLLTNLSSLVSGRRNSSLMACVAWELVAVVELSLMRPALRLLGPDSLGSPSSEPGSVTSLLSSISSTEMMALITMASSSLMLTSDTANTSASMSR